DKADEMATEARQPKKQVPWVPTSAYLSNAEYYVKMWRCRCGAENFGFRKTCYWCSGAPPPETAEMQRKQKEDMLSFPRPPDVGGDAPKVFDLVSDSVASHGVEPHKDEGTIFEESRAGNYEEDFVSVGGLGSQAAGCRAPQRVGASLISNPVGASLDSQTEDGRGTNASLPQPIGASRDFSESDGKHKDDDLEGVRSQACLDTLSDKVGLIGAQAFD
ncbi:unnamed protein product, partial [Prorocentrum cordatum]